MQGVARECVNGRYVATLRGDRVDGGEMKNKLAKVGELKDGVQGGGKGNGFPGGCEQKGGEKLKGGV